MSSIRDMTPRAFWDNADVRAFLGKALANPADDLPRLTLADWLEDTAAGELDTEHASFIRASVAGDPPFGQLLERLKLSPALAARIFWPYDPKKIAKKGYMPMPLRLPGYSFGSNRPHAAGLMAFVERGLFGCLSPAGIPRVSVLTNSIAALQYVAKFEKTRDIIPFRIKFLDPHVLEPEFIAGEVDHKRVVTTYYAERYEVPLPEIKDLIDRFGFDASRPGSAVLAFVVCHFWAKAFDRVGLGVPVHMSQSLADKLSGMTFAQIKPEAKRVTAEFRSGAYRMPTIAFPPVMPPRLG